MTKVPERLQPDSPEWAIAGHQHLQRYELASRWAEGRDVLDWACGAGFGSYVLAGAGARQVVGADVAPEPLAYAQSHYQRQNLSFTRADGDVAPPATEAFDLVVSFETIEHVPSPGRFLEHIAASLRPGGQLLLSAPNVLLHSQREGHAIHNEYHLHEPTYEDLQTWLAPRFEVLREWEQTPFADPFACDAATTAAARSQPRAYAWCRALNACEDALRALLARRFPAPTTLSAGWPARWAELLPLLPERRQAAHTFVLLCRLR